MPLLSARAGSGRAGVAFWLLCAGLLILPAAARAGSDLACAIARGRGCDLATAEAYGMIETGLTPQYPRGARCRKIDDGWAIDYSYKRSRPTRHGGIDIPAPFGTPILAASDGEVVAVMAGQNNQRGITVVVRASPADTGLKYWTFQGYSHLDRMPDLRVGDRVRIGQVIGVTGNSGQRRAGARGSRRPALHYSVTWGNSPRFKISRNEVVVNRGARWADPVALLGRLAILESRQLRALPAQAKRVPVAVMLADGRLSEPGAKVIWPYQCR